MRNYFRTMQFKMLKAYVLISVLTVILLSVFINMSIFTRLKDNAYNNMISMVETQVAGIEKEIQIMDSLAMSVLSSHTIKTYLKEMDEIGLESTEDDVYEARQVSNELASIIAPSFAASQLLFHDYNGRTFMSSSSYFKEADIKRIQWYPEVVEAEGNRFLTLPFDGDDSSMSTDTISSESMISLCRMAYDSYQIPRGLVEVKQYVRTVFGSIDRLTNNEMYTEAVVYDKKGRQIYPAETVEVSKDYFQMMSDFGEKDFYDVRLFEETGMESTYLMGIVESKELGWIIVLVSPKDMVMQDVNDYIRVLIIAVLIVLLIAIFIAYFAANQVTSPLKKLSRRIEEIDITDMEEFQSRCEDTGILEIDQLNDSFAQMNHKLKDSLNELVLTHQQEVQYHVLALQSQMNPHFLYNSLAMISAMAEEGMNEQITYTCRELSQMLRYIASSKEKEMTIDDELRYTRKYLEFMKLRFGDKINYTISCKDDVSKILIPKLLIQPLVENSIKICSLEAPPWRIDIGCNINGNGWLITVKDNGSGMTEAAQKELWDKIKQVEKDGVAPALELKGMGLLNIYIRLKLLYGEAKIFEITTDSSSGTQVKIGYQTNNTL